MAKPVTTALRRSQATAFVTPPAPNLRRLGPVVLMLSPRLEVLAQTQDTRQYLQVLVPPAEDRPPIPSSAYNVAAQLLSVESGVDRNAPWARVYLSDGLWLT